MNIKKIVGSAAVVFTLFLAACGPKDADISVSVTQNVQAAAPGVSSDVKDGVVTLSGQVSDEATRMAAEDAAKKAKGVKSVVNNITVMAPAAPTVEITPNGALQQGVNDAVKDFPEVTATVNADSEVVVTGEISSDKWKRLKMALDALNPKKVNADGLKIK
jgi:hyperosmotically inducible protein